MSKTNSVQMHTGRKDLCSSLINPIDIIYPVKTSLHNKKITFKGTIKKNKDDRYYNTNHYSGTIFCSWKFLNMVLSYSGARADWFIYYPDLYFHYNDIDIHITEEYVNFDNYFPEINEIPNWYNNHFESKDLIEKFKSKENNIPVEFDMYINMNKIKEFLDTKETILKLALNCVSDTKNKLLKEICNNNSTNI